MAACTEDSPREAQTGAFNLVRGGVGTSLVNVTFGEL